MTKSKSPKSDAKRPTKSSKKPAAKRVAAPKKAPKAPAKKPRGTTATYEAPREPAAVPTIDTPPTPEAEAPRAEVILVEKDADGREPIPGPTLVRALKYVHAVVPKEDGIVVYTHGDDGEPIVSGHDQGASFTWFLPRKAVWEIDAAVPRADSVRLLKLLEGLPSSALVRVYADCVAVIRHDVGQDEIRFALGNRVIVDGWQPPRKALRPQAIAPLRMDAGRARKGRAVPEAIARSWQSADGIEWIDVSDADTGETLARAVIAEDGRDLYPEDTRQTEIPGSLTAGASTNTARMSFFERAVREAETEVNEIAKAHGVRPLFPTAEETPTAAEVTFETDALDDDAPPVAPAAPTHPAPTENTTRLSLSASQWNGLDDAGRARLAEPESGAAIGWTERDSYFHADVPNDLVSLVHATGDELGVLFADDTDDTLGAQAEEAAVAQ